MASVCSGSLAMMAAGVPVKKAVAGIAMGLIADNGQVCILTDIQGLEDHYGRHGLQSRGHARRP